MTAMPRNNGARAAARSRATPVAAVLADRLAAALVHHEPGWRLPRLTTLARQYNVSSAEIDAAIDGLAARHLVRRLPDGQVYRASPAEYRVPLEGIIGLVSRIDPIGGQLLCASGHTDVRRPPEGIGRALGAAPSDPVLSIRCVWTVGGEPALLASSYVSKQVAQSWEYSRPRSLATTPHRNTTNRVARAHHWRSLSRGSLGRWQVHGQPQYRSRWACHPLPRRERCGWPQAGRWPR